MLYGDEPVKLAGNIYAPNNSAVRQSMNLYAYCGSNPVLYTDRGGDAYELAASWSASMWWLCFVDLGFPFGDAIYGIGTLACSVVGIVNTIGVDKIAHLISNTGDVFGYAAKPAENAANGAGNKLSDWASGGGSSPQPPKGPFDRFKTHTANNFRTGLERITGKPGIGQQAHHVFPQSHIDQFREANININLPQYGTWVGDTRQSWSYSYARAWDSFFLSFDKVAGGATQQQIFNYARYLGQVYGFEVNF